MSSSLRSFRLSHVCDVPEVNKLSRLLLPHRPCAVYKVRPITPDQRKISAPLPRPGAYAALQSNRYTYHAMRHERRFGRVSRRFFAGRAGLVMTLLTANDLCGSKSQRVYSPCRALPVGPAKRSERAALPNRSDRMRDNTVGLCCGMKKHTHLRFSAKFEIIFAHLQPKGLHIKERRNGKA